MHADPWTKEEEMKKDIILSGVGGQGILSIATVIGEAATATGITLKQSEVHGMSQRGGDVQSSLRLSTREIHSDIIPKGMTDLIIAMEPMEALRYLPCLAENGWVITSSQPFVNIPNYPDQEALDKELHAIKNLHAQDIDSMAKKIMMPKAANMILLGMAAPYIEIIPADELRKAIGRIFAAKGEAIVKKNIEAFDLGLASTGR